MLVVWCSKTFLPANILVKALAIVCVKYFSFLLWKSIWFAVHKTKIRKRKLIFFVVIVAWPSVSSTKRKIYFTIHWNFLVFFFENKKCIKKFLFRENPWPSVGSIKMNKKLENICRVCLNIGSRNIFEKSSTTNDSQFSIPAIGENVSSLDRLVEKLRYVTMLKVSGKTLHAFIHHHHHHRHQFSLKKVCFGAFFFSIVKSSMLWSLRLRLLIKKNVFNSKWRAEKKKHWRRKKRKQQINKCTNVRKRCEKMKLDQGFVLSTFVFIFCFWMCAVFTEYVG